MDDLEQLSKYFKQLLKEEKFENVLINFEKNKDRFDASEVVANQYLITDIFKAAKRANNPQFGLDFIKEYEIEISNLERKYCLNAYGWMIHDKLKSEGESGSIPEESIDLLIELLPLIDLEDEFSKTLFSNLLYKVTKAERQDSEPNIAVVWKLFKAVKFPQNELAKGVVREDEFIIPGILDVLKKSKRFEWAFGFLKMLQIDITAETQPKTLNAYGWLLYMKLKVESDNLRMPSYEAPDTLIIDYAENRIQDDNGIDLSPINQTLQLIGESLTFYSQEDGYSPFNLLFRKYLKVQKQKSNTNWTEVVDILEKFDPANLSVDCETMQVERKGRARDMELASVKENWYAYYTKAKYELEDFQSCFDACTTAISELSRLHYSNEIWFGIRIALCKKQLGDPESALADLESILKRKEEWFIQHEIAIIYYDKNEFDKAIGFAINAASGNRELEYRWRLFFLLGKLFIATEQHALGYKHFLLSKLLREEQGWKLPGELTSALSENKVENIESDYKNSNDLLRDLREVWKEYSPQKESNGFLKGKISNVREDKGFGFIKGDDGQDYYFKLRDFKGPKAQLADRQKVKFSLRPAKRQDQKPSAVNIRLLS